MAPWKIKRIRTPKELLLASHDKVEKRAQEEIKTLQASNAHPGQDLIAGQGNQVIFALNPSADRLLYFSDTINRATASFLNSPIESGAYLRTARSSAVSRLATSLPRSSFMSFGVTRASWLDNTHFVYDQIDPYKPYVSYRDLYLYDVRKGHFAPTD